MTEIATFDSHSALLQDGAMQMVRVVEDGEPVSFATTLTLLQDSSNFRDFFVALLRAAPFTAYRFETPALSFETAELPFEFVLVRDISLEREAQSGHFAEHFDQQPAGSSIAGFPNLGKDAYMIAPAPIADDSAYCHLGAFMRNAPEQQVQALWRRVGDAATLRLNDRPIWLNTAGGGVPWLHVRLDTRPKYYVFKPYTRRR